jgi:hypothetical protein
MRDVPPLVTLPDCRLRYNTKDRMLKFQLQVGQGAEINGDDPNRYPKCRFVITRPNTVVKEFALAVNWRRSQDSSPGLG